MVSPKKRKKKKKTESTEREREREEETGCYRLGLEHKLSGPRR